MALSPFVSLGTGGDGAGVESTPYIGGELAGERVLAPLVDADSTSVIDQLKVATTVARTADASVRVTNPGRVPDRTLREVRGRVDDADVEALLADMGDASGRAADGAAGAVVHGRRLVEDVLETVARAGVDTLVLPGDTPSDLFGRGLSERIAVQADCDVVVTNGEAGFDDVPSVLVPIAGGPHSGLAADVARRVAEDCDAWVDVLHVVPEDATRRERELADEYVAAAAERVGRPETTTTWVLEAADAADAIVEQSRYYGLTVLGAPTSGRLRQLLSGSTNRRIRENARSVVLSARSNGRSTSLGGD